jgi:hypothetical protein
MRIMPSQSGRIMGSIRLFNGQHEQAEIETFKELERDGSLHRV